MSNYPPGANEDRNAPWHDKEVRTKECPDCDGRGITPDSEIYSHTRFDICSNCNGKGKVPMTEEDFNDERDDAIINNYEMKNDD